MPLITLVVALLVLAVPLVGLARRFAIPYPVVLIVGGLLLGFVPGLPRIELDPALILVLFLPPLLYWESVTAPTDDMRAYGVWIWVLAIGLVIATALAVTVVVHAVVPGVSWAAAFALGAIVAPTDELAVVPTLERFRVPRHVVAIIEGESLLNDAGSLILYAVAVGAVVTGVFSWPGAVLHMLLAGIGGIVVGLAAGRLAVEAWARIDDRQLQQVISVVLPFVAYIPAEWLGLSGVLSVVFAAGYVNRLTPTVITPTARLQATGFWETMVFLANVVIYMLVGLQLHAIVTALVRYPVAMLIVSALALNAIIIATRFAWLFAQAYSPLFKRNAAGRETEWRHLIITAWSGFRGAVSLAAALALPVTIAGGRPFPDRNLLIFLTFSVILVTLVGGGLTLPTLVARLGVEDDKVSADEEQKARAAMAGAALERIDESERAGRLDAHTAAILRRRHRRQLTLAGRDQLDAEAGGRNTVAQQLAEAEREILIAQRSTLIDLRQRGEIDNVVLRRLQLMLDMEQAQLDGRARPGAS